LNYFAHQLKAIQTAQHYARYGFFWEPGAGKTIATYGIIDDHRVRGWTGRTLVLAPKSILACAWAADARHFPQLRVSVVWSKRAQERRRLIEAGADVYVTNYETFKKHAGDFKAAGVRRLVIDESSKVKNPTSDITRACIDFADWMESVYLLSGTPAPNNYTEYWSQCRIIDRNVFGPSFWRFAYNYFSPIKRTIEGRERIIGWKQIPEHAEEFTTRLRSCSWSLKKRDCLDLPPQTDVIREVELSPAEARAYTSMLEELRVEMADGRVLSAAVQARLMKLRQITSGIFYGSDGVTEIGRSKLAELAAVLEEIGESPVVIWAEFTAEIKRIVEELAGRSVAVLDGGTPLAARTAAVERFQGGGLQYLICHPAAAGHGITLTKASHAIYFSHSFSFETYQQSRDRIHRAGQAEPCTYWHLMAKGTVDEKIWWALRHKRGAHDSVMDLLREGRAKELV
jgi:SNF2 family DNA or RNA helicase